MRRIAIITGTRAEYGLLSDIIKRCQDSDLIDLNLIITGSHLTAQNGMTIAEIEADGIDIRKKIEILLASDSPVAISKATGLGIISFSEAFHELSPDLIVILGDRFEMLAAATAALYGQIPIAHIHGGETTEGAFDEGIRHAITKMSHWHYVATSIYRDRVMQLGEDPKRVFTVGGLGVDVMRKEFLTLPTLTELSEDLKFPLNKSYFLITYHPVTLSQKSEKDSILTFLRALTPYLKSYNAIITYPNVDSGSSEIIQELKSFALKNSDKVKLVSSLGRKRYWTAMKYCEAVIGNSSSGLLEASTFKKAVVNIGDRQKGRIAGENVISCYDDDICISEAIDKAISQEFQSSLISVESPYGNGGASEKIFNDLAYSDFPEVIKSFYDLNSNT